jgi:hypothetical protein
MSYEDYMKDCLFQQEISSSCDVQIHGSFVHFDRNFQDEYSDLMSALGINDMQSPQLLDTQINISLTNAQLADDSWINSKGLYFGECENEPEIFSEACDNSFEQRKITHDNSHETSLIAQFQMDEKEDSNKSSIEIHSGTKVEYSNQKISKSLKKIIKGRVGRRPENLGLTQRKDVLLKTLLRKMRTFLWSDFNSFTCFKANKSKQPSSYYHTCLRAYSSERLNEPADDTFLFYLSSIMSSRNTEELLLEEESSSWECLRENKLQK